MFTAVVHERPEPEPFTSKLDFFHQHHESVYTVDKGSLNKTSQSCCHPLGFDIFIVDPSWPPPDSPVYCYDVTGLTN